MNPARMERDEVVKALFELSKTLSLDLAERIPLTHIHALFRIAVAGSTGISVSELTDVFGLTPDSMASTVDALASIRFANQGTEQDVIEYCPATDQGGKAVVRLTSNGRALFAEFASRFKPLRAALEQAA